MYKKNIFKHNIIESIKFYVSKKHSFSIHKINNFQSAVFTIPKAISKFKKKSKDHLLITIQTQEFPLAQNQPEESHAINFDRTNA